MKPSILQDEIITQNSSNTTTKQYPNSQQQEAAALKCPRCDSTNTKFCYYNNYSLTQPRHFCKTCRRYWTKGGALRNVPIGGGCRKSTKKLKSSSSSSSCSSSSSNNSKLFCPVLVPAPAATPAACSSIDFQGLLLSSSFPTPTTNIYSLMAAGLNTNNNLATSIESLSSLNQDLHWKLQQQRLGNLIFGDHDDQNQKFLQPILFHNLDQAPKQDSSFINNHPTKESAAATTTTTEWFFGNNSYDHHHHHQVSATNISRDIIIGGSGSWNHNNNINNDNDNDNDGVVQAWEDLQHFTALP